MALSGIRPGRLRYDEGINRGRPRDTSYLVSRRIHAENVTYSHAFMCVASHTSSEMLVLRLAAGK